MSSSGCVTCAVAVGIEPGAGAMSRQARRRRADGRARLPIAHRRAADGPLRGSTSDGRTRCPVEHLCRDRLPARCGGAPARPRSRSAHRRRSHLRRTCTERPSQQDRPGQASVHARKAAERCGELRSQRVRPVQHAVLHEHGPINPAAMGLGSREPARTLGSAPGLSLLRPGVHISHPRFVPAQRGSRAGSVGDYPAWGRLSYAE